MAVEKRGRAFSESSSVWLGAVHLYVCKGVCVVVPQQCDWLHSFGKSELIELQNRETTQDKALESECVMVYVTKGCARSPGTVGGAAALASMLACFSCDHVCLFKLAKFFCNVRIRAARRHFTMGEALMV